MSIYNQETEKNEAQLYRTDYLPRGVFFLQAELISDQFYFGPNTGLALDLSFLLGSKRGVGQNLSNEYVNNSNGTGDDRIASSSGNYTRYFMGTSLNLVYVVGRKNDGPLRFYYGQGLKRSKYSGYVYLTHAENRSDACTNAVEANSNDIRESCEELKMDAASTEQFQSAGFFWKYTAPSGIPALLVFNISSPVTVEQEKYLFKTEAVAEVIFMLSW
ncbi:MAG: hypothetical protein QNL04_02440 [SAR324 cluster bacterium]|nr:hypothetical protein [SAR324 cluster bacterium]